jgi:hypothetical protein
LSASLRSQDDSKNKQQQHEHWPLLAACIFVAGRLVADLGEEALPVFLVAAVGFF